MTNRRYFCGSFEDAKQAFSRDSGRAGALLSTVYEPYRDVGEDPGTTFARIGNEDAPRALLIVSGTHGPEGLAGSACQRALLRHPDFLPERKESETEVILMHGINIWGMTYGLRCTKEGVDLNRNYVDFSDDLSQFNPEYDQVQEFLCTQSQQLSPREFVDRGPALLREEHGEEVVNTLFQGQYRHADGVGFGGHAPTAMRKMFDRIVEECLGEKKDVAVIDLHTGLGPHGVGLKLSVADSGSETAARTRRWYGDDVMFMNDSGSTLPYRVFGDTSSGVARVASRARITGITLEFGTYDVDGLVRCILAEYLIRHQSKDLSRRLVLDFKREIRQFFYPTNPEWREQIVDQALSVFFQALDGLAGESG